MDKVISGILAILSLRFGASSGCGMEEEAGGIEDEESTGLHVGRRVRLGHFLRLRKDCLDVNFA